MRGWPPPKTLTPLHAGEPSRPIECQQLWGALFFGAVALLEHLQKNLPVGTLVLDFAGVLYMDSTGLDSLMALSQTCKSEGTRLIVCSLSHQPRDILRRLEAQYVNEPSAALELAPSLEAALARLV